MYAAVIGDKIVATHDELEVINKFIIFERNPEYKAVKIKKGKLKKLRDDYEFNETYLVKYRHRYIPYSVYTTLDKEVNQTVDELVYCKDILYRILEEGNTSDKENKSVIKTISLLTAMIQEKVDTVEKMNYSVLSEMKDMDDEFRNKLQ